MRLRYLHLPRFGPLADVAVVFSQDGLLYGPHESAVGKRRGAINFVVGVNGTGKSSLLRAVYQVFHALRAGELPPFPVTLAWDVPAGDGTDSALLYHPGAPGTTACFGVWPQAPSNTSVDHWQRMTQLLHPATPGGKTTTAYAFGPDIAQGSTLAAYLPRLVAAYTSGAEKLWEEIARPKMDQPGLDELEAQTTDGERAALWTVEREWEEGRPVRVANLLADYSQRVARGESLGADLAQSLMAEVEPMAELSRKVMTNQVLRGKRGAERCLFIRDEELTFAGLLVGIWQAAGELAGQTTEAQQEELRRRYLEAGSSPAENSGARPVLNRLDWFWPTHLSLTYHDAEDRVSRGQREQLLCLCALADEVVRQPSGLCQAVVYLGPAEGLDVTKRLENAVAAGSLSGTTEAIARRMSQSRTGAEAFLRLFSEQPKVDGMLMEAFQGLRSWHASSLLQHMTVTVKRLRRVGPGPEPERQDLITSDLGESGGTTRSETEPDDAVQTYESLSDGEQALLGRMALLFLMRGQDNSLLLLDEPETHFNDVWKREIVDLVDDNVLKNTAAQVVIATHTSIALTDVFADEISLLRRTDGRIEAVAPSMPTLGEDPGEIMVRLFGAPETIGHRSAEYLDQLIRKAWRPEQRPELEELVKKVGAGYYRSELRAALKKLEDDTPH